MQSETKKQSIIGTWSGSAAVALLALMLCLIASSAFASNSWNASTGSWGTASNWSSGIVPNDTEQVKIEGGTTCTLDVAAGTFTLNKITVGTSGTMANLNIVNGGSITSVIEIQVGDASGKTGTVTQTGGTVNLNGTSSRDSRLLVGYKAGPGFYTLSGGSVVGNAYSEMIVGPRGSVNGGVGTFTMQETGGYISVTNLFVGVQDALGSYYGTGTLVFEIEGGVSAINAANVYIDPCNQADAVANLSVTKTGAPPAVDIILINNTGTNSVTGAFDNAAWGSTITLGSVNYTLTNTYIGGLDGLANDVALIPDMNTFTFTLTYTAGANGSIIGTTPQTVNYGTDGTAVTAQPALGYHFVKWSDDSTQNPRTDLNVTDDITVRAIFAPDIIMTVRKCKVAAGKTQYTGDSDFNDMKDSFTASGTMSVIPGDLNTIDHIDVNITSADGNVIFFESIDFNYVRNVQKNKFKHKYKIGKYNPTEGAITSLVVDFSKKTFAVTVSSADLTGLACPLQLIISLGDLVMGGDVDEAIVNGKNKTIPTRLMRLYDDKLVVTKAKAKNSTKKWFNTLSVKGDIAVADMNLYANEPNLCNEDVILTWGDGDVNTQTFVIPAGSFTASKKGHTYKCVIEAAAKDANVGIVIVIATLDLDKCTFTALVRGASGLFADAAGAGVFSVTFDTKEGTFDEEDDYTLP